MKQQLRTYRVKFDIIRQKVGLYGAIKYALLRFLSRILKIASMPSILNPVEFYAFISSSPFGEAIGDVDKKTINWVIPDFGIGSGGHLNIFRVVKKLEERGFICSINIDGPTNFSSAQEARGCIRKNFFPIQAEVGIGREALRPAAATFATSWTTAYTVRDFKGAGKQYYFVQDFEPFFFAHGSDYIFAEETYRFGFKGVTAGDWLAEKLAKEYGMETISFNFSCDTELYSPQTRRDPQKKRVFYYARPATPRRAFELGLLTLASIHNKNPDVELVLAGWDVSGYQIPFPHLNEGILPHADLPHLYGQCDVALVLSFTNLSLLPLEIMACNCAVVSNRGANVEWQLNKQLAKFADPTPEALSNAVIDLLSDTDDLKQLKAKGLAFSQSTSWDKEIKKIAVVLEQDLS